MDRDRVFDSLKLQNEKTRKVKVSNLSNIKVK